MSDEYGLCNDLNNMLMNKLFVFFISGLLWFWPHTVKCRGEQYLQQVTGADTESRDFVRYYTALSNAGLSGRDVYHLTAAEFAQLAPLMAHSSPVADQVKVLDHILNGVYHPLEAEPSSGNRSSESLEDEAFTLDKPSRLSVFPNPFSNEVHFVAPDGRVITQLTVSDISGKLLFERNYVAGEQSIIWQSDSIADGILLYSCQLSDGVIEHGKLIHSKKK